MAEKRERGKNYTEVEKEQFINICFKYKYLIENKKTDKVQLREKNEAWEKIKKEYDAIQTTGLREAKTLKILYDNLKMKARKEKNEDKKELYKTGGGTHIPTMTALSSQIVTELASQFEPLSNQYDSSSAYFNDGTVEVEEIESPCSGIIEDIVLNSSQLDSDKPPPVMPQYADKIMPPNKKTKLQHVYNKLHDMSDNRSTTNSIKLEMLRKEHEKKMEILETEQELAKVKLQNALKEQLLLDLKIKKLSS